MLFRHLSLIYLISFNTFFINIKSFLQKYPDLKKPLSSVHVKNSFPVLLNVLLHNLQFLFFGVIVYWKQSLSVSFLSTLYLLSFMFMLIVSFVFLITEILYWYITKNPHKLSFTRVLCFRFVLCLFIYCCFTYFFKV